MDLQTTFTVNVVNRGKLLSSYGGQSTPATIFKLRQYFSPSGVYNSMSMGTVVTKDEIEYVYDRDVLYGENILIEGLQST